MAHTDKIRVAVLYGGRSLEHEVSINSASNVIQNLDRSLFEVIPIGIDKKGGWLLGDELIKKELSAPLQLPSDQRLLFNPGLISQALHLGSDIAHLKSKDRLFDVVFPVIHGPLCEDGTVQGFLELANVPYVGCGVLASAIGMDKDVSKRLVSLANIAVPPFISIKKSMFDPMFCERVLLELGLPLFVKPANTGSSVGIRKVKTKEALMPAIEYSFQYDTKIIIEKGLDAVEIEIAVLESRDDATSPLVSIAGEIRPGKAHEFYSYTSKYIDENGAEIIIPAPISTTHQERLRQTAKTIFTTLGCEGMARVDLFLERNTDKIYFNEINTIPGFTQISMYPKLMVASGVSYSELLTQLVMLALDKHERKSQLAREYVG